MAPWLAHVAGAQARGQIGAERLALLLNQDGEPPEEAERARRRYLTVERQGSDGLSRFHGLLDPEARATLDAVLSAS